MPRVVPDQKSKFDSDDHFKKLGQEVDVKYTAYRDRPMEERKRRFIEDLHEGHSVITFIPTGTNLTLQFCPNCLNDEKVSDVKPSKESVDFDREPGRVHLTSDFIMNGVCVKWIGWMDMENLVGKAKLLFDEERAKLEDETMRQVLKETQDRVRMFDEAQRRWQQERLQSSPLSQQSSQ